MSGHYFAAEPAPTQRRTLVKARVWGHELELMSAPGVFAQGRVDLGTQVLFRSVPPPVTAASVLDLGCGYGMIACAVARAVPSAQVWAIDVNARARELTAENATALGVAARVTVCRPEQVSAEVTFDEIWSNPPIRIGKPALHTLLRHWLARLHPGGRAVLVVAKNLGADSLQRWLVEEGFRCTKVASAKGFRVLECRPVSAA